MAAGLEAGRSAFVAEVEALCGSKPFRGTLEKNVPALVERLAEPIADGLAEQAIRGALLDWREGKLRTLNDLEPEIVRRATRWIESSQGSKVIADCCAGWLRDLAPKFAKLTDPLCDRHKVPRATLRLPQSIDLRGAGGVPTASLDMLEILGVNTISGWVALIGSIVVATILGGGGTALLLSGPLGWVIGLFIGIGFFMWGTEKTGEAVKASNIPGFTRKMLLSERKIESQMEGMRASLEETIRERLGESEDAFKELCASVLPALQKALRAKAAGGARARKQLTA